MKVIIDQYGTPTETASAYREIERRTPPSLSRPRKPETIWNCIFGVYIDPRTWGALLFTFITFVTGIIYFVWVVAGVSISLSLLVLVIGVPVTILFLLSVQGFALLEGRLVEALLGERMPRRPAFAQPGLKWLERLGALVTDKHTWLSMLYMLLQLILGIVYFTLNVTLISLAVAFMAAPFVQIIWNIPVINMGRDTNVFLPYWGMILMVLSGFILLTLTLHLARMIGGLHGRYAKWMLVS